MADPIRLAVTVPLAPEDAFALFTEGIGTWWPLEDYSRAVNERLDVVATALELEPGLGGSLVERLSDGRVLPWGEVTAWDPPRRAALAWRPHSLPEPPTEVVVSFHAVEAGTRVELEHRGWERLSDAFLTEMYDLYVRGWPLTIDRFAAQAGRSTRPPGTNER